MRGHVELSACRAVFAVSLTSAWTIIYLDSQEEILSSNSYKFELQQKLSKNARTEEQ